MKTFLLIGAAILIAGAATVAVAADSKGRKCATHTSSAPTARHEAPRPAAVKAAPGKHRGKHRHASRHAHSRTHRK